MNTSSSAWSDKKSLLSQLEKLWNKGLLLEETVCSSSLFPKRLLFKTPDSKALSYDFDAVRCWVADIQKLKGFRIVYKTVRHPVIGENRVPVEVWLDTLETAIALLNKQKQISAYSELYEQTKRHTPELIKWVKHYPLKALGLADVWPKLLDFVRWSQQHPRPDIYLRQVSLPGIDSKFIEQHRPVLAALLDLALTEEQIDYTKTGIKQFEQRYGFRSKPEKIRFRLLDTGLTLLPPLLHGADNDINITANDFQQLQNSSLRKLTGD